jgi:hypothetical protein
LQTLGILGVNLIYGLLQIQWSQTLVALFIRPFRQRSIRNRYYKFSGPRFADVESFDEFTISKKRNDWCSNV